MKLKNIVTLISFLAVAVSCSMEDDVLNEITKSDPQDNSNQTEVYLSFDINVNSITTRANEIKDGTGGSTESVTDCSVILFENDKVIGVYDGSAVSKVEETYKLNDARFLVKVGRYYEVYVIGDTQQEFYECETKDDVEAIAFTDEDLTSKVKFGKKQVYITEDGSGSALGGYTTETVAVELSNLTAQVRLMDVVGDIKEGEASSDVQLIKVELLNQNTSYSLLGNDNTTIPMTLEDVVNDMKLSPFDIETGDWDVLKTDAIAEFVTFPNTEAKTATQIELTFKVGKDESQTRTYTINRPSDSDDGQGTTDNSTGTTYVNPGYIYQLYAKVSLIGDHISCELTCVTKDWLYNEYEVILDEVNN